MSVLYMTLNNLMVSNDGALRNAEYSFIFIAPGVEVANRVISMGQIELFNIQTLRKQITFAELNCLKWNS